MKEQFDKKLVDKIKASFDNHKEEYDPQQWEKLSSTYFAPKSGGFGASTLYWAAAALVAILGFSLLFYQLDFNAAEDQQVVSKNQELKNSDIIQPKLKNAEGQIPALEEMTNIDTAKPEMSSSKPPTTPRNISVGDQKSPQARGLIADKAIRSENTTEALPERIASTGENLSHDANLTEQYNIAGKDGEQKLLTQIQKQNEEKEALATIKKWLGEDESTINKREEEVLNPLRLGLLVIPQTTTSSNQAMNLGAGVMSEFSLSKKLKIDLGVAYAAQNLNPSAPRGAAFASADVASSRSAMFTNNFINTTSELRFGQIEIPLNLKYKVMDKASSGIYLISGVSNMFYINQQNVITYNTANIQTMGLMSADAMVQSFTETQTPNSTTDGGNVGQLINFGFGYERNLSSGTFISIEPFYKMSLGNQTFINQQFSIGGINLRMNFQLKK